MAKNLTAYIDIGTKTTRVALFDRNTKTGEVKLASIGDAPTRGVRYGYIIQQQTTTESVKKAIGNALRGTSATADQAIVTIAGKGLESIVATGTVIISKSDQEVTQFDIDKAVSEAESTLNLQNKKIIYQSPILFKIDGKEVLGNPEKFKGVKLEVKMLFVICLVQHVNDAIEAVTNAGIEVFDIVPAPLAAGSIVLSETQKTAGVVLVDIGADTTSFIVYENNVPIYVSVLPFGGNQITNDIALGLRISLEDAESIKLGGEHTFAKRKLDEITDARLFEIFETIEKHLKKIGKSGMLPAGVVCIGNGALYPSVKQIAEKTLAIPAKISSLDVPIGIKIKDSGWFSTIGLAFSSSPVKKSVGSLWHDIKKMFRGMITQLTP